MPRGASSGPKAGGSAAQRQLKRQRAQQAHAKVHPEGEDEANEPLKEPPTSWHHVVRMRVLDASTSQRTKFLWFSSGQLLVLIQWVVMLSFSSALSIRRCMSSSDCNPASYCAGLSTAPTMIDPLNASAVIHRGYCLGCSSRYPDELHVPALLDVICAPATNSESCLSDCMTTCTGNPGDRYITAPAKTRVHASAFTAAEHACSEQCASSCKSALSQPGKAAAALSSAEIAGEPLFSTWLSIVDQCRSCDASVREGVRFATPAEAENLQVLKMSGLDFVALGLASLIVALTMKREVRDINIGAMMTMQAIERQRNAKKDDEDAETTTSGATEGGPSFVRQNDEEASTAVPAVEVEKGGENILSDTLASGVDLGKDVLEEGKKMITKNTRMLISEFMMPTRLSSLGGDDEYWIGEDIYTHIWRYVLGIQVVIRRYIIIPEVASTVVLLVTRYGGDSVSIMLNTLAALFMLELDNLAFDYGLTAHMKGAAEKAFKVTLGPEQEFLLNWSRRWHVIALTIFFFVAVNTTVAYNSVWERLRGLSIPLIALIAVGELIEIAARFMRRDKSANAERVVSFVVKIACVITYKTLIPRSQWNFSRTPAFLQ